MGIPAESTLMRPRNRPGLALAAAIFGIVVVSLIGAAAWTLTELDMKATSNRVDAAGALRLAHTAETHARSLLTSRLRDTTYTRLITGADATPNTADDGLLSGYPGLGDSLNIPATGRVMAGLGTYFVSVSDDPKETDGLPFVDSNKRLLVTCRGVTTSGSTAQINFVIGSYSLPAIVVDGDLSVAAGLSVQGACGSIHANGNIDGSSVASVDQSTSATGSITHTTLRPGKPNSAAVDVPSLYPADFCGPAGYVYINATWKPKLSVVLGTYGQDRTYCVNGDLELTGDMTTEARASFIVSGYIVTSGSGFNHLKAAHPDGYVFMSGGDLKVGGNGKFTGILYAGGQCEFAAAATVVGQLICKDRSPHPGTSKVAVNKISGNATFIFDCNSSLSSANGVIAWYPSIGS